MSERAHIIDIDSIVLSAVDTSHRALLTAAIEAEVRRALGATELRALTTGIKGERSVAGEVAQTVVQSLRGPRGV